MRSTCSSKRWWIAVSGNGSPERVQSVIKQQGFSGGACAYKKPGLWWVYDCTGFQKGSLHLAVNASRNQDPDYDHEPGDERIIQMDSTGLVYGQGYNHLQIRCAYKVSNTRTRISCSPGVKRL